MVCPVCGYRYGIWRFYAIANPFRVRCRGCGTVLTVDRIVSKSLLTIAGFVLLVVGLLGAFRLADGLGLRNPVVIVALAIVSGFVFIVAEAWILYSFWRWARLSVREDRGVKPTDTPPNPE